MLGALFLNINYSVFVHQVVEDLRRPHSNISHTLVHLIVTTYIHSRSLAIYQILDNLFLIFLQCCSKRSPCSIPSSKLLGPVQSYVEVSTTVIKLLDLSAWGLVILQPLAHSVHHGVAKQGGVGRVSSLSQLLEPDSCGQVLSQGVPPEVTLLQELLHVLGSRTTSSCLQQNTSSKQRHDRQHLGTG